MEERYANEEADHQEQIHSVSPDQNVARASLTVGHANWAIGQVWWTCALRVALSLKVLASNSVQFRTVRLGNVAVHALILGEKVNEK